MKLVIDNSVARTIRADIGILLICLLFSIILSNISRIFSARKDEFETVFQCDGQTQEHTMLVKTVDVRYRDHGAAKKLSCHHRDSVISGSLCSCSHQ